MTIPSDWPDLKQPWLPLPSGRRSAMEAEAREEHIRHAAAILDNDDVLADIIELSDSLDKSHSTPIGITALANIEAFAPGAVAALQAAGNAAAMLASHWTRVFREAHCARCLRPANVDGVNPSLCTECEHRAAVRATAVLLSAMVVLSVAMILLGGIG